MIEDIDLWWNKNVLPCFKEVDDMQQELEDINEQCEIFNIECEKIRVEEI